MKRFLKWVAIIGGFFLIIFFIAYLIISALFDTEPVVGHHSYLQINLGGAIPEYNAPDALEEYLRGKSLDLNQIRQSLKMASLDERIQGVVLRIGFTMTGYAKMAEIHQMIRKFSPFYFPPISSRG